MPIYEFRCQRCEHRFEALVRASEAPLCPRCEGDRLERLLSSFAVGAAEPAPPCGELGPCSTCGDPRGPGACGLAP